MDLADALAGGGRLDGRAWTTAQLLAVDTAGNRARVSIDGGPGVWLPYVASSYTGITTVFVLRDPTRGGAGQLVLGPCGTQAPIDVPPPPPDPAVSPPAPVTARATIRPTWSGTWRASAAAWDRWNADRYGGRSTLYQGSAYGSGALTGLAVYGGQVVNLRALSITSAAVYALTVTGSGSLTVQGSASGSKPAGAPASSGSTATGMGWINLPADVREALRTGATRGFAAVGANYLAVRGTSYPAGMALRITYTRNA